MANTELSDIFVPEVFASYQVNDAVEKSVFVESGVVRQDPTLSQRADSGGLLTTIPFWNDLDASIEPNYSNTTYSDIADPQKINSDEQTARIAYLNEGFSSSDLNKELAGSDPMARIAARVDSYWVKQFQRRVLSIVIGIYNDNVAAGSSDMIVDVSSQVTDTITDANRLTASGLIDTVYTVGDHAVNMSVIAMHSIIYKKMLKDQLIDFVPDAQGKLTLPNYLGMRVVIDDGMPSTGTGINRKYICVVFGPGVIGYGAGNPKTPTEVTRYAERANGGGVEVLWSRKTWLLHPNGFDFLSASIASPGLSPTWANLQNAANWERVFDRKNIPLAFYVVNA